MPCRKYNSTSSKKFLLSCSGRSMKPLGEASGSWVIVGTGSSSVKLCRFIRCAAWFADVGVSMEACFRLCSTRPFIVPFACPFRLLLESVELVRLRGLVRASEFGFGDRLFLALLPICSSVLSSESDSEGELQRRWLLSGVFVEGMCRGASFLSWFRRELSGWWWTTMGDEGPNS